MLPKNARMSASLVRGIIREGKSARAAGLSVKYQAAASPKVAVVVSKKIAPGATERNRLRRLVFRSLPKTLPRAHMVLFVQSKAVDGTSVATLCSQLF
jgi:ribonuclease P protein component